MNDRISNKFGVVIIILLFIVGAFSVSSQEIIQTSSRLSMKNSTHPILKNFSSFNNGWQQINQDGFGDKNDVVTRAMTVFAGYLCVGVTNMNLSSGEINGCELWCYNGTTWIQSVGNHPGALIGSGFGNTYNAECSILVAFHGFLYAGTENYHDGCELWRTTNPVNGTWEKVVIKGFGDRSNVGMWSTEIFNNDLYIGTFSYKGCQIWRTENGADWEAVIGGSSHTPSGFGAPMNVYAWSMKVYDGKLYVGTQNMFGGEIWRSTDGTTWECLVGRQGIYPRGFQVFDVNYGIRTLNIFKGDLYAGTAAMPSVAVTFEMTGFFNRTFRIPLFRSPEIGLQIWRLNGSNDRVCERVVGGFQGVNSSRNGFGDNHNVYAWTMSVFHDTLYVGTYNVIKEYIPVSFGKMFQNKKGGIAFWVGSDMLKKKGDGCEIWKTVDGTNWVQVVGNETMGPGNGFGDINNNGARSIAIYQMNNEDALIIGTSNAMTGCEIWKYQ
jgi:hypothetical protein